MQNIKEKLMSQSSEKCCCKEQMDKLGHFGPFCPIFGSASFKYLWSLNFMQNIKKTNELPYVWTHVHMDRPKFIGSLQNVGPIN